MTKFTRIVLAAVFLFTGAMATNAMAAGDPDFDPPLAPLPAHPGIPADNPSGTNVFPSKMGPKQELGYKMFFETKLSGDQSVSCATCHHPDSGWGFNDPISRGYPGTVHWRNSQTILNTGYLQSIFWVGQTTSLEAQAPVAAKGLSGNGEADMMESRLYMVPEYRKRWKEVFGNKVLIKDAWAAIAAFERYMSTPNTPADKFLKGDKKAISASAQKGKKLFEGKAGCVECHNGPVTTDEKRYNLGVPQPMEFAENGINQATFRFEQYAKGVTEDIYRNNKYDLGLFYREKRDVDKMKFRTPPLRHLKYTAPYMHNGVFFTLEEVVDFYNKGGGDNDPFGTKTKIMKKLNLTDAEKADLVAWLQAYSGDDIKLPIPKLPPIEAFSDWKPKK